VPPTITRWTRRNRSGRVVLKNGDFGVRFIYREMSPPKLSPSAHTSATSHPDGRPRPARSCWLRSRGTGPAEDHVFHSVNLLACLPQASDLPCEQDDSPPKKMKKLTTAPQRAAYRPGARNFPSSMGVSFVVDSDAKLDRRRERMGSYHPNQSHTPFNNIPGSPLGGLETGIRSKPDRFLFRC